MTELKSHIVLVRAKLSELTWEPAGQRKPGTVETRLPEGPVWPAPHCRREPAEGVRGLAAHLSAHPSPGGRPNPHSPSPCRPHAAPVKQPCDSAASLRKMGSHSLLCSLPTGLKPRNVLALLRVTTYEVSHAHRLHGQYNTERSRAWSGSQKQAGTRDPHNGFLPKQDLFAYICMHFWHLLSTGSGRKDKRGSLGVIRGLYQELMGY